MRHHYHRWWCCGCIVLFLLLIGDRGVQSQSTKVQKSRRIATEGQILARLFSGDSYDPFARPPVAGCFDNTIPHSSQHGSVVVIISAYLNRISWQNDHAHVDLYLRQQWEDARLTYDVDPREGIHEVRVGANRRIWLPDTYFTIGEEVSTSPATANAGVAPRRQLQLVIEPGGFVRASEKRSLLLPITYGARFPFANVRKIQLRLSSYSYPIEDIVYVWANSPPTVVPIEVSDQLLHLGTFQFHQAEATDCVGNYSIGVYSCVEVSITFVGSTIEPLFRIFIPSVFLVVVSWLHFWVHGSWSVPRTISAALPFFIFAILIIFYPQPYLSYSGGIGGIQIWLLFCILITCLSLIEYFIVICCGIRRKIRYFNGALSSEHEHPLTATAREAADEAYDTRCSRFQQNNGVDIISRFLFPVIFILFIALYLLYYLVV